MIFVNWLKKTVMFCYEYIDTYIPVTCDESFSGGWGLLGYFADGCHSFPGIDFGAIV